MQEHKGVVSTEMPEIKYDLIDKKLIAAVSQNSRFTPSFLGKLVGLSKDGVRYRLEKLYKNHTLLANVPIVSPYALGYGFYALAFDIKDPSLEQEKELMMQLANHPNTVWVGRSIGKWNLVVFFFSKANKRKEAESSIIKLCKPYIKESVSVEITALHTYHNLPQWFVKEAGLKEIKIQRQDASFHKLFEKPSVSKGAVQLDALDYSIIAVLAPNCNISIAEIAKKLGKPFNTIKNRVQRMIKEDVILAFNPLTNISYLNMLTFAAFIELSDESETDKIKTFIKNHPDNGFTFEIDGPWRFALYGAVKNNIQLHNDMNELRSRFKSIKGITTKVILKDYKFTLTPACVFQ